MNLLYRLSFLILVGLVLATGVVGAEPSSPAVDPAPAPSVVKSRHFQRWWWAFGQRAYPLDDVPANAKGRALEQIRRAKAAERDPAADLAEPRWFGLGPAPQLGGQVGATLGTRPMSGRATAIAVDPSNGNRWLVGTAQGGVWETHDAGVTWTPKTDARPSLAIGAIAFAPGNPSIVYVGTGEPNRSNDSYGGAGLLKSTDGGNTWTLLAAATFAKNSFSALAVDPGNANTLVAAATLGIAGRVATFASALPPRGLHRSTDGGVTWARTRDGAASDLAVDPTNFNRQYGGVGDAFQNAASNLVRSTDGGQTWNVIGGPWSQADIGRISLAIAPSNPNVLYVAIQRARTNAGGATEGGLLGLFRTDNAWAATPTFVSIPQPAATDPLGFCGFDLAFPTAWEEGEIEEEPDAQCSYDMLITADPGNPDTLYAGGVQLWKCTGCGATPTWQEISKHLSNPTQGIHADQHAAAWAGTRLIVGNDGGVWSTADGGASFVDHNTTLSTTQFYAGSLHPTDAFFALGGSQDNGTAKWTGADAWATVRGGDGTGSAISSSSPNTQWAVVTQDLNIVRTTDGGASFTVATSGIDRSDAPFISHFKKCPANDNVFVAGTTRIWRSANFFSAATPTWADNNSGSFNANVSALAFAPSDATCNTYAAGSATGGLRLTTNGGASWVDLDAGNAVPDRAVTDLAFHPTDPNVLYVTLSGFDEGTPGQPGHLFKTVNALSPSRVWANVSPPANLPLNSIALDPLNPETVYVGADVGVWRSVNGGAGWVHMGPETGMPNVAVFDVKISPSTNRIVAFTHGRGAFTLTNASLSLSLSANQSTFAVGQTLVVGGAATNPGLPGAADFYAGLLRPDNSIQFLTSTGIVAGNLADLGSFRPIATAVPLKTPFAVTQASFYTRQWTAGTLSGPYLFFLAAVRAGALAAGTIAGDQILAIATAPFTFQ